MRTFEIKPIGIVRNSYDSVVQKEEMKFLMNEVSIIEVFEEYSEGLFRTEEQEFLNVVFYFDRSPKDFDFLCDTPMGETRGVFACRSPRRPNSLGTTVVRLIKRDGNKLYVTGLDAINDTPVIDIKNANTMLLETNRTYVSRYQANPRVDIEELIDKKLFSGLLIKAAQLHNHFCPGLTFGVLAATYAMNEFKKEYGDWKNMRVNVESKTCFLDGVQFVTGCTLGNKGLSIIDNGTTALTLFREGKRKGIKVSVNEEINRFITENFPEFTKMRKTIGNGNQKPEDLANFKAMALEVAFALVETETERFFDIEKVSLYGKMRHI